MKKLRLHIIFCCLLSYPLVTAATTIERVFVKGGMMKFRNSDVMTGNFEIAKYETTNEQYAAFLNARQIGEDGVYKGMKLINSVSIDLQLEFQQSEWKPKKGFNNYPIVMVSYYGAVEFCNWIGAKLPSETEWAYAAKGGAKSKHYIFAGSKLLEEVGWFKNNSNGHSHAVGEKKPNELGIYDLSGNVWEWCINDSLKSMNDFCVHMGGSWYAGEQPARLDVHYGNTATHFSNSVGFRVMFPDAPLTILSSSIQNYKGKPWNNQPQEIPGKIQCEWYDLGGEAVAYHDKDSINNGSGKLNPANGTFLNEFRMKEAVDISYSKPKEIDNSPYNLAEPVMGELYAGWTIPGEWINYTVKVNQTGLYTVGIMYTASGHGEISLLLDGKELTSELMIPSTRNAKETIDWRQWHHWNRLDSLTTVKLKKGRHVLTIKTISNGNMNYDYLEFSLKK